MIKQFFKNIAKFRKIRKFFKTFDIISRYLSATNFVFFFAGGFGAKKINKIKASALFMRCCQI